MRRKSQPRANLCEAQACLGEPCPDDPPLLRRVILAAKKVCFSPRTDWVDGGAWGTIQREILFQSFVQKAIMSSSGTDGDVHSL